MSGEEGEISSGGGSEGGSTGSTRSEAQGALQGWAGGLLEVPKRVTSVSANLPLVNNSVYES